MPTKCGTAPFLSTCLYIIYTLFQLCSQYRTYIHIDKQDIIYNKSAQLGRTQQGETLTEVNSLFDQMESVQRRALNIIFPDTSCELARDNANVPTLSERRFSLCNRLFRRMSQPPHKLNCLFPKYSQPIIIFASKILCSYPSSEH